MGEGKGSTLVHLLVVVLSLVAFGFAIAAERRRSVGVVVKDDISNATYCESLLMGVTKCMCFGRPLAPGSERAWSIIYLFHHGKLTFLVAEACLIAGCNKERLSHQVSRDDLCPELSCETLRKGVSLQQRCCGCDNGSQRILLHVFHQGNHHNPRSQGKSIESNVG
ncbi:hypothetical protein GQ457_04G007020 [Hibiscus cannabinus]